MACGGGLPQVLAAEAAMQAYGRLSAICGWPFIRRLGLESCKGCQGAAQGAAHPNPEPSSAARLTA